MATPPPPPGWAQGKQERSIQARRLIGRDRRARPMAPRGRQADGRFDVHAEAD